MGQSLARLQAYTTRDVVEVVTRAALPAAERRTPSNNARVVVGVRDAKTKRRLHQLASTLKEETGKEWTEDDVWELVLKTAHNAKQRKAPTHRASPLSTHATKAVAMLLYLTAAATGVDAVGDAYYKVEKEAVIADAHAMITGSDLTPGRALQTINFEMELNKLGDKYNHIQGMSQMISKDDTKPLGPNVWTNASEFAGGLRVVAKRIQEVAPEAEFLSFGTYLMSTSNAKDFERGGRKSFAKTVHQDESAYYSCNSGVPFNVNLDEPFGQVTFTYALPHEGYRAQAFPTIAYGPSKETPIPMPVLQEDEQILTMFEPDAFHQGVHRIGSLVRLDAFYSTRAPLSREQQLELYGPFLQPLRTRVDDLLRAMRDAKTAAKEHDRHMFSTFIKKLEAFSERMWTQPFDNFLHDDLYNSAMDIKSAVHDDVFDAFASAAKQFFIFHQEETYQYTRFWFGERTRVGRGIDEPPVFYDVDAGRTSLGKLRAAVHRTTLAEFLALAPTL